VGGTPGSIVVTPIAQTPNTIAATAAETAGTPAAVADAVAPHLLPDPALEWLRRAHGALGVWVAEIDPDEEGPRAERIVDAERLSVAQIVAVDRRLERARDGEESGVERLDGGTFVFRAQEGTAVGILLPGDLVDGRSSLEDDVRRLLDGIRRKPQVVALVQAGTRQASFESAASVGLRLAYQIERMLGAHGLGAEVAVAVTEAAGVRVIGVSGRADRRLLDRVVPEASDLARVARGVVRGSELALPAAAGEVIASDDPLGGMLADRRQGAKAAAKVAAKVALLAPMYADKERVGAVAVWIASGQALTPAAQAELQEALANAAPRFRQAAAVEDAGGSVIDPLTGLANRRGFEELLGRADTPRGVVIGIDLDRFAHLNEILGPTAGDAALVHIGRLIQSQVRGGDVPARACGAAFALWLPNAEVDLGVKVAERVRAKIGATPWDWQGKTWPLSASFGVAIYAGDGNVQDVIIQADTAIALAKRNGRNRVEKAG